MTILASVNNKTLMPGITPIADVPDRPTIGTATAGEGSASVTFTASTTGGTPTTFTATSNPGSITGTASSSPITVSGLSGGTSYTFTVTAGNSTGTSPASSASNSVTPTTVISGGYDSLATVTLSASTTSINFSGIPSGYKHLELRYLCNTTRVGGASGSGVIEFNGDTTVANYSTHALYGVGSGSGAAAGYANNNYSIWYYGDTTTYVAGVVDVLDYANTNKYKTIRNLTGYDQNGAGQISLVSMAWRNTAAVSSIVLTPSGYSFNTNSSFALYGIK
jgi:hypothetical protein